MGLRSSAQTSKAPAVVAKGGATLDGTVTDQTGAVLTTASVTVTDSSGKKATATSDQRGQYRVQGLAAGTYSLTVSAPNFKDFHSDGLTLTVGQSLTIDAVLEPAGEKTSVNVEANKVTQVETDTSQIVGVITEKELVSLGLNGRNFTQLIALTPGVSNQTGQDEAKVGVLGSVRYSVNGGRVEYNSFNVDGGDVINVGLNGNSSTLIVYPSLDALSEVQVLTSNYGAMYGRSASGTVVAETKSGTNNLHGNAYEFLRNEFFNSKNYFDQVPKAPLYRKNDFGVTLGGPVIIPKIYNGKDKTYFFGSEEFRIERSPIPYNQGVPSAAEQLGNFSDVCPFVLPPMNGLPGSSTTFSRDKYPDCPGILQQAAGQNGKPAVYFTFPGNVVPIDPNAQALLNNNILPLPNSTTGCNSSIGSCLTGDVSPSTYWREELFKIDHSLTPKNKLSLRYIHDQWNTIVLSPQWATVGNSFPNLQNRFVGPGLSVLTNLTSTISSSMLNQFVFSYTTDHITMENIDSNGTLWQRPPSLTMGYLFNNGFGGKMPGIDIQGSNLEYGGTVSGWIRDICRGATPIRHTIFAMISVKFSASIRCRRACSG